MRILFSTQPGWGHFKPMAPLADALQTAGHEVRFASSAAFAAVIESAGFRAVRVGVDFSWDQAEISHERLLASARSGRAMENAAEFTWGQWVPKAARDLVASFASWTPDVVVREFSENAATLAGAAAGIPVVCSSWSALPTDASRWATVLDWDRALARYEAIATSMDISPDPIAAWERQLTVTNLPPSWFEGAVRPNEVQSFSLLPVGAPRAPRGGPGSAADREQLLIYATLGTVFNRLDSVRRSIIDALATLEAEVLLTVGPNVDPASIGPTPASMRVERFVPQESVLTEAALVVSHAGLGTMLGALYHGVPMVSIGLGGDQPLNAALAGQAGVSIPLSIEQADAPTIAAAAHRALRDPSMRARSAAIRSECESLPSVNRMVDLFVERFG